MNNKQILEAAHAFNSQYTVSMQCAEAIYRSIKNNEKFTVVDFKPYDLKAASLLGALFRFQEDNGEIGGQFARVSHDYAVIDIFYNPWLFTDSEKGDIINRLFKTVTHELGHANAFFKTGRLNLTRDYDLWVSVISDTTKLYGQEVYNFFFSLYVVDYHEQQALVSEAYACFMDELRKSNEKADNIDKETFLRLLKQTKPYQYYIRAWNTAHNIMTNPGVFDKLINNLPKAWGYNDKRIYSSCVRIKKQSRKAFEKIFNNVYVYFNEDLSDSGLKLYEIALKYVRDITKEN